MNKEKKSHVDRGTLQPFGLDGNFGSESARDAAPQNGPSQPAVDSPAAAMETPGRFPQGTIIDRYRLVRCIGRGGMGEVYLAQHQRLSSRFYAIKFLKSEFSESNLRQRFEIEIDAMERLKHPNIIYAEDAGEYSGNVYLVTEFVDGQDLAEISRLHGALSVPDATEVILQAARGLQHAFEHALVHRDLKPSNLMLSKDGIVKILDLGLARFVNANEGKKLTGSLQLLGTPDYMSPEQCRSAKSIDIRSDIYSLGCTLYCLLGGRPPFDDADHQSIVTKLTAHVTEAPRPITDFATADIPEGLRQLLSRMLEKDPEDRFHTPSELIESISGFTEGSDLRKLIDASSHRMAGEDLSTLRTAMDETQKPSQRLGAGVLSDPLKRAILISFVGLIAVAACAYFLGPSFLPSAPDVSPGRMTQDTSNEAPEKTTNEADEDTIASSSKPNQDSKLQANANASADVNSGDIPEEPSAAQTSSFSVATTPETAIEVPRIVATTNASKGVSSGYQVLEKYCIRCHGDNYEYPALDFRDRLSLLQPADESEAPYLVEGNLEESRLWLRANGGGMPPEEQPQPSKAELAVLGDWIKAGAEFPKASRPKRAFVGERSLIELIDEDLQGLASADRGFVRYFSLSHLWNDEATTDEQLRLARAAVSKLINSLSSQPRIVVPTVVDPDALVLRIDLRDYGWRNATHWLALLRRYPWGLKINGPHADRVYQQTNCEIPYIRADWFIHSAARPPLYHELVTLPDQMGLPKELSELERLLGINIQANINSNRVWRAGFSGKKSGVSDHNRIVERHDSRYGYFWPSYDSAGDIGRQNFANFPLGPVQLQPGNSSQSNLKAFKHDGGEFIASLPNGMQFYLLATADGKRLDRGPQSIVRDPNQFSGSFDVVNGISCIGCHKLGMIPATDTIREQWQRRTDDEVAQKVLKLYPPKEKMDAMLAADRKRFTDALELACGSFLRTGANDQRAIHLFPEPITATARYYDRSLDLSDVARELGLPTDLQTAQDAGLRATAEQLPTIIEFNDNLKRRGLLPLTVGDSITRKQWENAFPTTVRELNLGQFQMIR